MKVFISWSGEKSRDVAVLFRDWLPLVLNAVRPFVSSKDIRAGSRWQTEIASELDETNFGLICVTRDNKSAEWLNFEAGALAKAVDSSRVVPLAVDLAPTEIATPHGQFQAIRPTADDVTSMLSSMNEVASPSISDEHLRKAVGKWWPELDEGLDEIVSRTYDAARDLAPQRSDRDLLEELLEVVREVNRVPSPGTAHVGSPQSPPDLLRMVLSSAGINSWSASIEGSTVKVQLEAPPTPATRRAAEEALSAFGMKVDFSAPPSANVEG